MDHRDQIQRELQQLPPEKQGEVLDFVLSLQEQLAASQHRSKQRSLRQHPAFGSWRGRKIDAIDYQRALRSEWDAHV